MFKRWYNRRIFYRNVAPKMESFLKSDGISTNALEMFKMSLDEAPDVGLFTALDCFIYLIETDQDLETIEKCSILNSLLLNLEDEKFICQ